MVADVQLACLRDNDNPEPDSGLAAVHAFFPKEVGAFALFAEQHRRLKSLLLSPQDAWTLCVVREDHHRAVVRASVIPAPGAERGITPPIVFHLVRTPTPAGPCWLNDAVQFCDSS